MRTTDMSPAMQALAEAGQNYTALQKARDKALTELQEAIRVADREQLPDGRRNLRAEIIRTAGVARQTVYDALREPDPAPEADG